MGKNKDALQLENRTADDPRGTPAGKKDVQREKVEDLGGDHFFKFGSLSGPARTCPPARESENQKRKEAGVTAVAKDSLRGEKKSLIKPDWTKEGEPSCDCESQGSHL